jgi:hypothetical protein
MGRNSVEATKASLMRAVRARRAALTAGLAGLLAALPVRLADLVAFLPSLDGCFVFCTDCCAVFLFAVEEAVPAGLVVEPPEDCPASGNTTIKKESRPARQCEASRETEVGEDVTLISSM